MEGHYEDEGRKRDELRRRKLSKFGVTLLRFSDHEILNNTDGVYELILKTLKKD